MNTFPAVPFADVDALEAGWRPLTADEKESAPELLRRASIKVKNQCKNAKNTDLETLEMVVCDIVKRAMSAPPQMGFGVESWQQGGGPYQGTVKYANPMGDLYISKENRKDLGCGGQTAFTIRRGGDRVPR